MAMQRGAPPCAQVLRTMSSTARMAECGQERCSGALDLSGRDAWLLTLCHGPCGAISANGHERERRDRDARERAARVSRRTDQSSAGGTITSGQSFAATAAPRKAQPMPSRPASNASQRSDHEQRGPEVEPRQDQRSDQSGASVLRRTPLRGGRTRARRRLRRRRRPLQPPERGRVVVEEGGNDERRQRTGRVLDREVAVGDAMVVDDRGAVAW